MVGRRHGWKQVQELPGVGSAGPRLLDFKVPELLHMNMRKAKATAEALIDTNHTQVAARQQQSGHARAA